MTYLYPYRRGTGWRSQAFRGNRNQGANGAGGHTGFDQAMNAGTPLYAPGDGIIRNSGWLSDNYRDNGWWLTRMGGDTLVIDMVDSFRRSESLPTFILAHCSDTMAEVGQFVRKGQLVALSGNTGTATTGPHVHIEAPPPNWDFGNGVYGRVDPELYFDEYVDDYAGIAAMGGTITPVQEDDMANVPQAEWADALAILHSLDRNVITDTKLAAALSTLPLGVWSYQNAELGGGDAFQILRDALASTTRLTDTVAGAAAKAAAGGADEATIKASVKEAITELLIAGAGK